MSLIDLVEQFQYLVKESHHEDQDDDFDPYLMACQRGFRSMTIQRHNYDSLVTKKETGVALINVTGANQFEWYLFRSHGKRLYYIFKKYNEEEIYWREIFDNLEDENVNIVN